MYSTWFRRKYLRYACSSKPLSANFLRLYPIPQIYELFCRKGIKYTLAEGKNVWFSFKMKLGEDLGNQYYKSDLNDNMSAI
jgi:hypothetical protein